MAPSFFPPSTNWLISRPLERALLSPWSFVSAARYMWERESLLLLLTMRFRRCNTSSSSRQDGVSLHSISRMKNIYIYISEKKNITHLIRRVRGTSRYISAWSIRGARSAGTWPVERLYVRAGVITSVDSRNHDAVRGQYIYIGYLYIYTHTKLLLLLLMLLKSFSFTLRYTRCVYIMAAWMDNIMGTACETPSRLFI